MVLGSLQPPEPAEFYALFCTAQIPANVINKFLQQSEEDSKWTPNIWSLILAKTQKRADRPTQPPVPEDTTTDFHNASFDDLGAFCHEKFDPDKKPQPESRIAHDAFAVMDERTLKDETVVLVAWEMWDERIDPKSWDDSDEAFRRVEGWASVRVPMKQASDRMGAVSGDFRIYEMRDHLEEMDDGVFRVD